MALTNETGVGLSNAEAYCTLAFADAWHLGRGITLWATMLEAEREQAIRRATDYMVQVYRFRWAGLRKSTTQALDWPRLDVPCLDTPGGFYASDIVPVEVQRACAELAFKAASGDLAPDIGRVAIREKIDVIEVEYAAGSVPWVRYRAIDTMLAPMFSPSAGSGISLVRC